MALAGLKAKIRKLPPTERRELMAFISELNRRENGTRLDARSLVGELDKRASDLRTGRVRGKSTGEAYGFSL